MQKEPPYLEELSERSVTAVGIWKQLSGTVVSNLNGIK